MGYERHKEIILRAVGIHLRTENICCLLACDHTGQVSGQGVNDLQNTMHVHHPSSKTMSWYFPCHMNANYAETKQKLASV